MIFGHFLSVLIKLKKLKIMENSKKYPLHTTVLTLWVFQEIMTSRDSFPIIIQVVGLFYAPFSSTYFMFNQRTNARARSLPPIDLCRSILDPINVMN